MKTERATGITAALVVSALMLVLGWILGKNDHLPATAKRIVVTDSALSDSIVEISKDLAREYDDTIWNDSVDLILQNDLGEIYLRRWYRPAHTFDDYPVRNIYKGSIPAKLNFSTCSWGKEYKTMTRYGLQDGVAFAGHYAFAAWRCGAPCQGCSIIDLTNGNVYAGPDASNGYDFRVDSRLLIVNPPYENGLVEDCAWCTPEQYLWTGTSFKRIE